MKLVMEAKGIWSATKISMQTSHPTKVILARDYHSRHLLPISCGDCQVICDLQNHSWFSNLEIKTERFFE